MESDLEHEIPEPLNNILQCYFNIELFWFSFPADLIKDLANNPEMAVAFKAQFANMIVNSTITPLQYKKLTSSKLMSEGELYSWLRKLWGCIYGEEPIPGDEE